MNDDTIIGNEDIKEYLRKSIDNNKVSHSYIFCGTEGIGKLLLAKQFARKILCLKNEENCKCKSCLCLENDNHTDFTLINKNDETIKIDDIRNIIKKISEYPITSNKKVIIINNSENMTIEAQNCLLKTLEEPPQFVVIILITSNDTLLLQTIRSRCMILKFQNISNIDIKNYINNNIEANEISECMLNFINGSLGRASLCIENLEKFKKIELLLDKFQTDDIIEITNFSKELLEKDEISVLLEYMINYAYEKGKTNNKYFEVVNIINKCKERLERNCNYDMCIDQMLVKIWKEIR